ncbi:LOW QUALITY PROTEIN: hypothetical protein V2J09_006309 [Rumex salicifolius]
MASTDQSNNTCTLKNSSTPSTSKPTPTALRNKHSVLDSLNLQECHHIKLQLKQGLPVMLLRNVNPITRVIITHLGDRVIEAEIITGTCIGDRVLIPQITLSSTQTKWPFIMKRRQFPIKPCLVMMINKSQGQSLKVVGLYLPKPVFCRGQLYVAVSRVTHPMGLKIMVISGTDQPQNITINLVFKEAFNNLLPNNRCEMKTFK